MLDIDLSLTLETPWPLPNLEDWLGFLILCNILPIILLSCMLILVFLLEPCPFLSYDAYILNKRYILDKFNLDDI
jgi:hypothetical protein